LNYADQGVFAAAVQISGIIIIYAVLHGVYDVNNAGKFHPKKQKTTRDYCTVEAQNEEGLVLAK
jgi:hypothetical protein